MQREYKLEKNKFLIEFQNKYFVVNEETKEFIENLKQSSDETEFAEKMHYSNRKAIRLLNKFYKKVQSCKYYEFNVLLPSPLKVQWKITNRCNLKCKHCYLGELDNECLSENDLFEISNKIIQTQVLEVTITGGEALTVPNLLDIIHNFISNGITVSLFTNAILIGNFLEKCKTVNKKLLKILVSLDGDKEAHEEIRGKNTFDVTLNNIKKSVDYGFDTTVNCVINKLNYKTVPNMLEKLINIGVSKVQLSNLMLLGSATSSLILTNSDYQELHNDIQGKMKLLGNPPILIFLSDAESDDVAQGKTIYMQNANQDDNNLVDLGKEKWKCAAGISRIIINHKGDVLCCPFMNDYGLGNVLKNSFEEIWNSEYRFQFLKRIQQTNNSRKCIAMESSYEKQK